MAEARNGEGWGTAEAAQSDEPTGNNAIVCQFDGSASRKWVGYGPTSQKSKTQEHLHVIYIFSFHSNNTIYIFGSECYSKLLKG